MTSYTSLLPPYEHQKTYAARSQGRAAYACLAGMRTGKTYMTINEWGKLVWEDELDDQLIIAPAGVYRTWEAEYKKFLPMEMQERLQTFTWESGGGTGFKNRLTKFLLSPDPERPRVLLINLEALSTVARAREACEVFLRSRRAAMAVDESTGIKGPGSLRTVAVLNLGRHARMKRILTGLVAPRSPLDLFSQFEFLDPKILGFKTYCDFEQRHSIYERMSLGPPPGEAPSYYPGTDTMANERFINRIVGYRYVEEIADKIAPHSFRVRLDECYDVPKKLYIPRYIDWAIKAGPPVVDQKKIYKDLKQQAFAELEGGHVTATRILTRLIRLHQVLCGFVKDDDGVTIRDVPESKTKTILSILEEYDGKAVIWCAYRESVQRIKAALHDRFGVGSVACFWGGNKDTRETEEARWKADPACMYMVATAGAGARGRTWAGTANLTIYHSSTENLEHRDQSEERVQGIGKETPCTYIDVFIPGTVEEKIIGALRAKLDLLTVLTGENYREWLI